MDELIAPIDISDSVNTALTNVSDEPTKQIGHTLGDLWFLVFGGISQAAEKRRLKYLHDLELYHQQLDDKIQQIPEKHYVEPSIQVTAQALDTSKYCISEPELREMFVNLISNSMDSRKNSSVHPSFPEIIKQMTPLDAKIISTFKSKKKQPIIDIVLKNKSGGQGTLFSYAYIGIPDVFFHISAPAISSLERLGLINVRFDSWFLDDAVYTPFKNRAEYLSLVALHNQISPEQTIDISKGMCILTPLGEQFIKACLP